MSGCPSAHAHSDEDRGGFWPLAVKSSLLFPLRNPTATTHSRTWSSKLHDGLVNFSDDRPYSLRCEAAPPTAASFRRTTRPPGPAWRRFLPPPPPARPGPSSSLSRRPWAPPSPIAAAMQPLLSRRV